MVITVSKSSLLPLGLSIDAFLRRQGYAVLFDRRENQYSYARRLTRDFYPRFHVYVEEKGQEYLIKLHLDQKRASYQGASRHSGEYEGELVAAEAARLRSVLPVSIPPLKNQEISDIIPRHSLPGGLEEKSAKPGFFRRLFKKY